MNAPEWNNGEPTNLAAAAADALEWLILLRNRRLLDTLNRRDGFPGDQVADLKERLELAGTALAEQLGGCEIGKPLTG